MCGITGIISFDHPQIDRDILKKMNDTLRFRGPDAEGFSFADHCGLGHRRLSIIDLEGGKQPMNSLDGRYTITFNGEIYNFLELREKLKQERNTIFETHSDTEVLLNLYMLHGKDCLKFLNGMFAFAIWDKETKTLFAARDRMGKKPFYYALVKNHFIFASELKALLKFPLLEKKVSPWSIQNFLTFEYVPAPDTILQGVNKLKAAHHLSLSLRDNKAPTPVIERYWNQPLGKPCEDDEKTATKKIVSLLDQAVEYRMIADVPLGVFLSGGIDSSIIVALMARHREGKDIKTFSINFEEASFDESLYSSTVAKKFNTDHHEETLTANVMLDLLPEVARYLDEPFADASILPTYLLSRFTRKHVTVALGGDGGDELFAGYDTFVADRYARLYQKFPGWCDKLVRKFSTLLLVSDKNMSFDFKLRQFLSGVEPLSKTYGEVIRQQSWLAGMSFEEQSFLFRKEIFSSHHNQIRLLTKEMENCPSKEIGNQLLYFFQKFYLCDDILYKVDRASMANSLEVRAPFLDVNVVEYASRLPYSLKLKGITTKYLLKRAFNRHLPAMITQRKKKGFGIPISAWLKNELKPLLLTTLSQDRIEYDGYFHWPNVEQLIQDHLSGKRNNRKTLFSLLMFHFWMDEYLK